MSPLSFSQLQQLLSGNGQTANDQQTVTVGGRQIPSPFTTLSAPYSQVNALAQMMTNPQSLYRQQQAVINAQGKSAKQEAGQYITQQGLGPAAYTQFLRDQAANQAGLLGQARGSSYLNANSQNADLVRSQIEALLNIRNQDLGQRMGLAELVHNISAG